MFILNGYNTRNEKRLSLIPWIVKLQLGVIHTTSTRIQFHVKWHYCFFWTYSRTLAPCLTSTSFHFSFLFLYQNCLYILEIKLINHLSKIVVRTVLDKGFVGIIASIVVAPRFSRRAFVATGNTPWYA